MNSLIVFSPLRWDFACQRPQHVLSRLSRRWRILFVEEPVFDAGDPWSEMHAPMNNVTVMRPHTPLNAPGFHDDQIPLLQKLVGHAVEREQLGRYGAWLYTPMALPLLQKLSPHVLVYDCMDELTGFRHAPRQLVQRENALIRMANVVFTGGPGVHESRRDRHPNVHLFPGSVDREHFGRALEPSITAPEIRALPRPRLGFAGVLDERVDLELLRTIGERRPDWQLCMVGPVVKIDPLALPRLPNIHYFGPRGYEELPSFMAGWDAGLLPFAQNESTRCISPTKTLEYMAAGLPIVSTSIADVRALHGDVVRFADDADGFLAACDDCLVEPPQRRASRAAAMASAVARTSWDATAQGMADLVAVASRHGLTEAAGRMYEPVAARKPKAATAGPPQPVDAPCVIVGAGPTGLSAAYHYGDGAVLLEREASVGGWCRSIEDTGFTFDHAGHIMFSNDVYVQDLYRLLLGDNVHWQDREAWIYVKGAYERYPVEGAPRGRAAHVTVDRLSCAIEARDFATAYNRKLWTLPPGDTETVDGRVALPGLDEMVEGGTHSPTRPGGPARFGYPLRGGFQALVNGFLPLLRADLQLRAVVDRVSPLLRTVTLRDGRRFRYGTLVSTMPLPHLVSAMGDEPPAEIRRAAAELRHVSVRCVNLGVGRPHLTDKHWIYYPEEPVFHRIFMQGNASPHCNPPGGFGLTCEISYSQAKPLPATGRALVDRCIADCIRVGILNGSDPILTANQVDLPYAYVICDSGRQTRVRQIREWLVQFDIVPAGRYGGWEYSEHAFVAGRRAAEAAREHSASQRAAKTA